MKLTHILGAVFAASLWATGAISATYTVNFSESGGNVSAVGSGSLDVTGLTGSDQFIDQSRVGPALGFFFFDNGNYTAWESIFTPLNFGPGGLSTADSSSGDNVGVWTGGNFFYTPVGYVSGTTLSASATWLGSSFASLGMTQGQYSTTSGNNTFVVNVGVAPIPVPASLPLLAIGIGGLGYMARRKRIAA